MTENELKILFISAKKGKAKLKVLFTNGLINNEDYVKQTGEYDNYIHYLKKAIKKVRENQ